MSDHFFTSDTHFGHTGILRHCAKTRPFKDAKEMDEAMIHNWNARVKPNDTVWHLGDFCWDTVDPFAIRTRLNGKIHIVWGNHDKNTRRNSHLFESSHELVEIKSNGQKIVLCHYAMQVWNGSHKGSWHLYGHSHGTLATNPFSLSMDVGVDCHGMAPISFRQVAYIMSQKIYTPVDHHGRDLMEDLENMIKND